LAVVLVFWALPMFSDIAGQDLSVQLRSNPLVLPVLLLFGLLTGILAGSYPAFFMSSFNPITVLKGKFTYGKGTINLRSGLVIFQFFISIILIVATAVVYNQLSYIQHKKLGYDKNQVVVIPDTYWLGKNQEAYRQQLLADPRIVSVSSSRYLPAGPSNNNNFFVSRDGHASEGITTLRYEADENYIPTLGIEMALGRNFSRDYGADSTAIILNETAAKLFGWNKDAIGHTLNHRDNDGTSITYHVIGVVKDFHFRSLHEKITPLVMTMGSDFGTMIAKVKTADISGVLSAMKKNWDDFKPEESFFYSFLDDRYNNMYKAEQTIGKVLGIFTSLTILVACLGLFGLATITAEQRTKEIGIRKVLGANVAGIVSLLSKDFLKLVLIAFIIATPVGWYVMNRWLQDFAYRINLSWTVFALAALLAVVITLVTVSFQAIRAAIANPVNSLRSE
ncbi:MAG TPA: FtsX-like permease family protein, partial [Chryseolinea sp.]|nr:FtsX-like permease family protein [Chryseolinea sp.]